jgi:hypothetical protein
MTRLRSLARLLRAVRAELARGVDLAQTPVWPVLRDYPYRRP